MQEKKQYYTLITGASAGIGKALAEQFAQQKHNLVLIALPNQSLINTTQEIQEKYKVNVVYFGIDLSEADAAHRIFQWCKEEGITVSHLINNAGIGLSGAFENYSAEFYQKMIQLNVTSLVMLTRLFLPEMMPQKNAYILNVSSMAGLVHVPFKIIYSSTKHFVYSFSMSLRAELKGTNVSVTVLCPLGVATNPNVEKRVKEIGLAAQVTYLTPEFVAKTTIKKMYQGRAVVKPGLVTVLYDWVIRIIPYTWQQKILYYFFQRSKSEAENLHLESNTQKTSIES